MASAGEPEQCVDLRREDQFNQLFAASEGRLFAYILALVASWPDAEDLLQETAAVLWHKLDGYEAGTDFAAWAIGVARFEVLRHRKKRGRERAVFGDATLAVLAEEMAERVAGIDDRREALDGCIRKLVGRDRELIRLRYEAGSTVQGIAEGAGLSTQAVYKALNRVHGLLLDCVRRALAAEGLRP